MVFENCLNCDYPFDVEDGVEKGYIYCLECGCPNRDQPTLSMCYSKREHDGPCQFTEPDPEPTPEEMAEVYRSLGVTPEESGTLL